MFFLTVLGQLGKPKSGTGADYQGPNHFNRKVSANPVTVTNDLKIGSCPLAILKRLYTKGPSINEKLKIWGDVTYGWSLSQI